MHFDGGPVIGAADLVLGVDGGVHHLGDALAVHGGEHGGEADAADPAENDVEGHVDLGVLATELLRRDVDAAARRYDDTDGLVDDVDALEHVHGVVVVGHGDAEDVDAVHQAVHHAVAALHADDDLAARGRQGVVANGLRCVGVVRDGVLVGGEGTAGLAECRECAEGA